MSIRTFKDVITSKRQLKELQLDHCPFCNSSLSGLGSIDRSDPHYPRHYPDITNLIVCNYCGWWVVSRYQAEIYGAGTNGGNDAYGDSTYWYSRIAGKLKQMDMTDASIPIDELSRQLIIKRQSRFIINHKRFENLVGGVFRDFGYDVIATSYGGGKGRGDKGIDIIVLNNSNNEVIGIQVKRTVNRIEAEQIRSLLGALILKGITKGIFVTTSQYREGAKLTADESKSKGVPILLWDGETFLDKLKISLRPAYNTIDDPDAPYYPYIQNKQSLIPYDYKSYYEVYD